MRSAPGSWRCTSSGSRRRGGRRPETVACPLLRPPAGSILEPPLPQGGPAVHPKVGRPGPPKSRRPIHPKYASKLARKISAHEAKKALTTAAELRYSRQYKGKFPPYLGGPCLGGPLEKRWAGKRFKRGKWPLAPTSHPPVASTSPPPFSVTAPFSHLSRFKQPPASSRRHSLCPILLADTEPSE